jgi:hypothetical protein
LDTDKRLSEAGLGPSFCAEEDILQADDPVKLLDAEQEAFQQGLGALAKALKEAQDA